MRCWHIQEGGRREEEGGEREKEKRKRGEGEVGEKRGRSTQHATK